VHHSNEDTHMFPALEHRYPELEPVMERLRAEHEKIARLLDELKTLLADGDVAPADLLSEVERLTHELEAHLDYEEAQLVPLLSG
jgi:hemerythrin-like domain-containing protein